MCDRGLQEPIMQMVHVEKVLGGSCRAVTARQSLIPAPESHEEQVGARSGTPRTRRCRSHIKAAAFGAPEPPRAGPLRARSAPPGAAAPTAPGAPRAPRPVPGEPAAVPVPAGAHGPTGARTAPGVAALPRRGHRTGRGSVKGVGNAPNLEGRGGGEAPSEPGGGKRTREPPQSPNTGAGAAGEGERDPQRLPQGRGERREQTRRGIFTAGREHEPCPRRGRAARTPPQPPPLCPPFPPAAVPRGGPLGPARPPPPFGIAAMAARPPPARAAPGTGTAPPPGPRLWAARSAAAPGAPGGAVRTARSGAGSPRGFLSSRGAAARAVGSVLVRQQSGQLRGGATGGAAARGPRVTAAARPERAVSGAGVGIGTGTGSGPGWGPGPGLGSGPGPGQESEPGPAASPHPASPCFRCGAVGAGPGGLSISGI